MKTTFEEKQLKKVNVSDSLIVVGAVGVTISWAEQKADPIPHVSLPYPSPIRKGTHLLLG